MPRNHQQDDDPFGFEKAPQRDVSARWTLPLIAEGWTGISNVFLKNYSTLDPPITYGEAMFIIHLMQYKWEQAAPYPSMKRIAKQMGISITAARRHARSLQNKKYLYRDARPGQTNKYDLKPLFEKLEDRLYDRDTKPNVSSEPTDESLANVATEDPW